MTEAAKSAGTATLTLGDKSVDLPVLTGTTGPDVIDIRKLYAATDAFTFDPGFTSTAACESAITYIDGDAGILLHRGYPIDQLASKSNFLEVCHLLLHGELPTAAEYAEFEQTITRHTMLHAQFDRFFEGFRRDAHPMAIMVGTVGALSAFYHDSLDIHDPVQRNISAIRLIAKMPTHRGPRLQIPHRPAVRFAAQRPELRRELPAHVLRRSGRGLCRRSHDGQGHGPDLHPARRPRAERLDLDRPPGRFVGRQSVRLYRRRHRLPVGPVARRRQRRGAEDAQGDRHARQDPRVHRGREGQEIQADGLRPPGLQELRPARDGDEGIGRRDPRPGRRPRTIRCSRSPRSWSASP